MKGKITVNFFIDEKGNFHTSFNIKEQPDNVALFIQHAALSTLKVFDTLERILNERKEKGGNNVGNSGAD